MRLPVLLIALCLCVTPALAQQKTPIEITADKTLEWHRTNQSYIARGNAKAVQGNTTLKADTLTARYTNDKAATLTRIKADGNVHMTSGTSTVTGQNGDYDIAKGLAEVTGNNLKLTTPTDTVTAHDKLTYNTKSREARAIGNARAIRPQEIIQGDTLIARFRPDPTTGKDALYELEAVGNVKIDTPTETLYADQAIYMAHTQKATMTGNVRIERDGNTISGARGETDLTTHISRIYADPSSDTRVRGVFYPE